MGNVGLPIAALRRFEVLRPTASWFQGAQRGAIWGAVLGLVASSGIAAASDRGIIDWQLSVPIISGGILAGGVVGSLFLRSSVWQTLSLPGR
jgi:hypothetical protein